MLEPLQKESFGVNRTVCRCVRIALFIIMCFLAPACDADDESFSDETALAIQCQILGPCAGDTRFGMVGDSWTDFGFGAPIQGDMYDLLLREHGYEVTAVVLAGQTLSNDLYSARGFQRVIEAGGPEMRYMLLSLGGNDMLDGLQAYVSGDQSAVLNTRLTQYEFNLRAMIDQGNLLKQSVYGGGPLIWVLHGYDYANPEKVSFCNVTGITAAEKETLMQDTLDAFNSKQIAFAASDPNVRYIDLRGTLGGPPTSNGNLKIDCIHPNDAGFALITARYVEGLQLITSER